METQHDRRTDSGHEMRRALMQLRLVELAAHPYLRPGLSRELKAAIDGVVAIVRNMEGAE